MRILTLLVFSLALALSLAGCDKIKDSPNGSLSSGNLIAPAVDPGWPRDFSKDGQTVTVYQPQVIDWPDYAVIHYRAAVAVMQKGAKQLKYGVLEVEAQTNTDQDTRTVLMYEEKITTRFPNVTDSESRKLESIVRDALPTIHTFSISLDRVLAYMKSSVAPARVVNVNQNPPPIFFSEKPAVLLIFVGPPEFKPVEGTSLMFAVNTNWDCFLDTKTNRYFLRNGSSWLSTADPVKGPWNAAGDLPADLSKLPRNANWEDAIKNVPGKREAVIPDVFVSTQPAELILTDGSPDFSPIIGTSLMYVTNTQSPLFLDTQQNDYYFLVAGRWFRSKNLEGPWSAATTSLPSDFSRIPADSPVAYISASVPGTQDANDAILIASIPTRATVDRSTATLYVTYDGAPQFIPIEGTAMTYAVNTPNAVIRVNGLYYCCYQGVWFQTDAPLGTWAVCVSVPNELYAIPVTNPLYNVTYVRVYSSTPTTVIVGYTGGYHGQYIAAGVIMFGAGVAIGAAITNNNDWVYVSHYHVSSAYYSYGCGAVYHGSSVGFSRTAQVYGPYGGAGHAAVYNPSTGAWGRSAYAYGSSGSAFARQAYNPGTGVGAAQIGGSNPYGSWRRGVISKGNEWVSGGRNSNANGTVGWAQSSNGRAVAGWKGDNGNAIATDSRGGTAIKTNNGDVFAGSDGNAYRRQDDQWQTDSGSGWNSMARSSSTQSRGLFSNLDRDSSARSFGNFGSSNFSSRFGGGGRSFGGGGFGGRR